ncbi:MAG TPA: hypothetical protein VGE64_10860 [Xanthomonadaceae bacterium]
MSWFTGKTAPKPPPMEIEMQELPPKRSVVETPRGRSGSFSGQLVTHSGWTHTGTTDYSFSATRREMDVQNIQSHAPGAGSQMMQAVESRARDVGATSMVTATSRPGFFKKMGFDYTEQQKRTNTLKEARDPGLVARDESNKGEQGGGGYGMFKPL